MDKLFEYWSIGNIDMIDFFLMYLEYEVIEVIGIKV